MRKYFLIPTLMLLFFTTLVTFTLMNGYYISLFLKFDQVYFLSLVPISVLFLIVFISMKRVENKSKFDILFRIISLILTMLISALILFEPKFYMQFAFGLQLTILLIIWILNIINALYWIFIRKIIISKL